MKKRVLSGMGCTWQSLGKSQVRLSARKGPPLKWGAFLRYPTTVTWTHFRPHMNPFQCHMKPFKWPCNPSTYKQGGLLGDFNARLHKRFDSDPDLVGPYVFGKVGAQPDVSSNRSLLLEVCQSHQLAIANTFFHHPPHEQATCYNVGATPHSDVIPDNFGQIDFMLISQNAVSLVEDVCANQQYPLASHHFLVTAKLQVQVQNTQRWLWKPTYDLTPLKSFEKCNHFSALFEQHMSQAETVDCDCESANNLCDRMTAAIRSIS